MPSLLVLTTISLPSLTSAILLPFKSLVCSPSPTSIQVYPDPPVSTHQKLIFFRCNLSFPRIEGDRVLVRGSSSKQLIWSKHERSGGPKKWFALACSGATKRNCLQQRPTPLKCARLHRVLQLPKASQWAISVLTNDKSKRGLGNTAAQEPRNGEGAGVRLSKLSRSSLNDKSETGSEDFDGRENGRFPFTNGWLEDSNLNQRGKLQSGVSSSSPTKVKARFNRIARSTGGKGDANFLESDLGPSSQIHNVKVGPILQGTDPCRTDSAEGHTRAQDHQAQGSGIQGEGCTRSGRVQALHSHKPQQEVNTEQIIAESSSQDSTGKQRGTEGLVKEQVEAEGCDEQVHLGCCLERNRQVDCEVEIISWRERRIAATVCIQASMERVWEVLTDYEKLAEFIPNLVRSERISCPHPGRVWLLQQGMQQAMYWQIEARVVLDLHEHPCTAGGKELHFEMVDGDFKRYAGKWSLKSVCGGTQTLLIYEVNVIPQLLLPTVFLERIIKADLPKNLMAIADRAEERSRLQPTPSAPNLEDPSNNGANEGPVPALIAQLAEKASTDIQLSVELGLEMSLGEQMAQSGSTVRKEVEDHDDGSQKGGMQNGVGRSQDEARMGRLSITSKVAASTIEGAIGVGDWASVAVASIPAADCGSTTREAQSPQGFAGLTWGGVDSSKFGGTRGLCRLGKVCRADEIHLRRLDDLLEKGGVHRRVVASITIQASADEVWQVLTDYERLSEFVPNLAASKVIYRDRDTVQLLQEGCKCLMYMVLHARVVLELRESRRREISFQQVEGDFVQFHGRWLLEPQGARHTRLKYSVETKMRPETILAEAIVEEVIYEDLPTNLCAIRDRVEEFREQAIAKQVAHKGVLTSSFRTRGGTTAAMAAELAATNSAAAESAAVPQPPVPLDAPHGAEGSTQVQQPAKWRQVGEDSGVVEEPEAASKRQIIKGLFTDFSVLEAELTSFIATHGNLGVMPKRPELRKKNRSDLERAIARLGGYEEVAARMGLRMAYQRKPKHYWDNFDNVRDEVQQFQLEAGCAPTLMPSRKSLEKAGRYDLARALEKWGGLGEVARLLGLGVRRRKTKIAPSEASTIELEVTRGNALAQESTDERNEEEDEVARRRRRSMKTSRRGSGLATGGSDVGVAMEEESSPKPMKAPVPASSRKWVTMWSKSTEPESGP